MDNIILYPFFTSLTFKHPYPLEILVAIKFSSRFLFKNEKSQEKEQKLDLFQFLALAAGVSHILTLKEQGVLSIFGLCVMCCAGSLSKNDDFHFSQVPPLAPPALTGVAVKLAKFRGGVILRNTGTAGETKAGTLVNLNFITWMYVNIFSPNCIFLSEVSRAFMEPIKRNNNPH